MDEKLLQKTFSREILVRLFPPDKTDSFFDALFGDSKEGAFDIGLNYSGCEGEELNFELLLKQRPGKCLACHLTNGIPEVFLRHPIIDIQGLVRKIGELVGSPKQPEWKLGQTQQISQELHVVPLTVGLTTPAKLQRDIRQSGSEQVEGQRNPALGGNIGP